MDDAFKPRRPKRQLGGSQKLVSRARRLRRRATDAEHLLWFHLRDRRFLGWKFRRQVPVGPFIVDFLCLEARLIVEIDGGQHAAEIDYDTRRTSRLEAQGFRVERFWNNEVLEELRNVLEQIRLALEEQAPSPCPSPGGRGDPSTGIDKETDESG